MKVLAIDTTSDRGSLALLDESHVFEEVVVESVDGFSTILFGEIEALIARHGLSLSQIDAFAAASGPGSFTGVRVGLTAAKGLAEALGKQALGISNLQALATFSRGELRATVIDARRGQVYGAVYNSRLAPVLEETVIKLDEWLASLPAGDLEILSRNLVLPEDVRRRVTLIAQPLAAAMGRIALGRIQAGEISLPEHLDANYVRQSDAELFWLDSK